MLARRWIAHILNRALLVIPSLLLLGGIAYLINPDYFVFGTDGQAGWKVLYLYRYLAFLPLVYVDIIRTFPRESLQIIELIGPALLCVIALESATIILLKRTIGMKIMGLALVSTKQTPPSALRLVMRTILKYCTLAFLPILLLYILFDKEHKTLHDRLTSTKVVRAIKM